MKTLKSLAITIVPALCLIAAFMSPVVTVGAKRAPAFNSYKTSQSLIADVADHLSRK